MQSHTIEPFSNNWAYLKAELTWLDRVLGMAIARQRQETKVVDRVARSRVDRVTSHWWRGLVTLEGEAAYDSPVENPRQRSTIPKASYQQQLEAKIKVSQQSGIVLGLPLLCSRLQLGTAEKNLLLMALAPEISRRYARLYNYLQETEHPGATGLPTVDLILRLLCRTDADWRSLRQSLTEDSALIKHQLLDLRSSHAHPLLARPVKLPDPLVNYLLADQPESHALETLLQPPPCSAPASPLSSLLTSSPFPSPTQNLWSALILPPALLADLQHLCHRVQFAQQVDEDWGFAATGLQLDDRVGTIALLVGASGTGKTLAVRAIAQTLKTPLLCVDLAQLHQDDVPSLLQAITTQAPPVLLLKSAECWFSRTSALPNTVLHQFLALRQQQQSITLLSVHHKHSLAAQWRRELHRLLAFPMPTQAERLKLWQQAFPEVVPLAEIDWEQLAHLPLSGGDIYTIARDAAIYAAAANIKLTTQHLIQAYERVKGSQSRGRKL
ncbi:AAA family ATPase [Leptolyngbya sp. FACHB-321]|uniref:AAA family ATPase n=1 Tax=Leptolyngbya sp. FACHB-321 TaxID=2692807 RepID=UPI0016882B58|nr:AAA family ATPase [Leptolyngbya sp. FACHB-321]MBD2037870.1 AAA family ATPase [Leptolyngbya sp. FACHB-321]